MNRSTRRTFLQQTAATAAVSMGAGRLALAGGIEPEATLVLKKSLKYGMVSIEAPMVIEIKECQRSVPEATNTATCKIGSRNRAPHV